jgi:hypothetical protein
MTFCIFFHSEGQRVSSQSRVVQWYYQYQFDVRKLVLDRVQIWLLRILKVLYIRVRGVKMVKTISAYLRLDKTIL